ncbi:MAG: Ldh family oxidoreductase [Deltaproteobacteria bacterium]|jgi:LDH2 family malate/lactate/ureidoglycolate dehydrogenase|nr:Ldh family oxidoreductase [Deltaproteobacteria bacterium]
MEIKDIRYRVDVSKLIPFAAKVLTKYGEDPEYASITANALAEADICGVRSHGFVRFGQYITKIKKGSLAIKNPIEVAHETETTALVNGNNGMGFVISQKAVELARAKAAKSDIAFVSVYNANHFGAAGIWGSRLAGQDMIGFAGSNAERIVSAPGGLGRAIGSNPFSLAAPAGKYGNLCLDISAGAMAQGKIWEYRRLNKPFPPQCWLRPDGVETTDPFSADFAEFIMFPFGAHKGFGLAVMMECLSALLAGGPLNKEVPSLARDMDKPQLLSQFYCAIRIEAFRPLADFIKGAETIIEYIHELPVREGFPPVMYPGEPEFLSRKKALEEGLLIPETVAKEVLGLAEAVDILDGQEVFNQRLEMS